MLGILKEFQIIIFCKTEFTKGCGVFRIQLDSTLHKVIDIKRQSELELGKNSGLITYKGQILYTSEDGVFNYENNEEKFKKNIDLSEKVSPYKSVKMVVDQADKLYTKGASSKTYNEAERNAIAACKLYDNALHGSKKNDN